MYDEVISIEVTKNGTADTYVYEDFCKEFLQRVWDGDCDMELPEDFWELTLEEQLDLACDLEGDRKASWIHWNFV